MSSSNSASRIAAKTSGGAMAWTKARKASGSAGGWCRSYPITRQDPPVLLLGEQHEAGGPVRLGTDGDEPLAGQGARAQAQVSGGILHVDRELLLRRLVVADRRQPAGARPPRPVASRTRSASRVSSAPSAPRRIRTPVTRSRAAVATSPTTSHRSTTSTVGSARTRGARDLPGRAGWPGRWWPMSGWPWRRSRWPPRGEANLSKVPDHRCAAAVEVVEQPREQFVEDLRPPGQQQVGVPTLGDALPILAVSGSGSRSTTVTRPYASASTRAASSPASSPRGPPRGHRSSASRTSGVLQVLRR